MHDAVPGAGNGAGAPLRFAPEALVVTCAAVLGAAGLPAAEATLVARHLVESNRAGHDSHGVVRVAQYAADLRAGRIVADATPEVVVDRPALVVIDGHWAAGQVVAARAVDLARERARTQGVAVVAARRSGHTGRLGAYVEELARRGCVGLAMVNNHGAGLVMSPPGGTQRRLSPNPIAFAAPGPETARSGEPAFLLDMTTSAVAEGKLRVARNRGAAVPAAWVRDADGRPTTDPAAFYGRPGGLAAAAADAADAEADDAGSIPPFGGEAAYKAFGLALVVEVLAGLLPGAAASGEPGPAGANALWLLAVDVEAAGAADLPARVERLLAWVRSSRLAPETAAITVPGDPERAARRARAAVVEVDAETWRQLTAAGVELGLDAERFAVPAEERRQAGGG